MSWIQKKTFDVNLSDDSIVLICVVRDELLLLPYFIEHYKKLGVTHFVFIDNASQDGTLSYLMDECEINCQLYHTTDNYSENDYGLVWVNKILNNICKNKWCVVVDVDELILPRGEETLCTLRDKMIQSDKNVLPTCLIDFYPKHFDTNTYDSKLPFYSHSNYYDKFNESDMLIYPGNGGELAVKGGARYRVYDNNNEPVCLTKKSFFKYDFFNTHILSVGMHWLLPLKFDVDNVAWGDFDWSLYNKYIKFYQNICAVGHFKFIKPNINEFFKKRVERNQDWNNSAEYKNYANQNINTMFSNDISTKFVSNDKIYEDVFDNGINKKELLIIVSEQRMGTTTLCEKLDKLPQSVCLYEAFEESSGRLYNSSGYSDMKYQIENFIENTDWVRHKKYISFKVFRNHFKNWDEMSNLLSIDMPKKVVFLNRNLLDSYNSWVEAHKTGNWGTTPDRKKSLVGMTDNTMQLDQRHTFVEYSKRVKKWFDFCRKKVKEYKIQSEEIWFGSVICDDFKPQNILRKRGR